jgi:hypothetical protein
MIWIVARVQIREMGVTCFDLNVTDLILTCALIYKRISHGQQLCVNRIQVGRHRGGVENGLRDYIITRTSETGGGSELDESGLTVTHGSESRAEVVWALRCNPRIDHLERQAAIVVANPST